MPCIGAGWKRRAKAAAGMLEAGVSCFVLSLFQSSPRGPSFLPKVLPSSAAQQCQRPAIPYIGLSP